MSQRSLRTFTAALVLAFLASLPGPAAGAGAPVERVGAARLVADVGDEPVDSDGDGVPDDVDACPSTPGESAYGGCPVSDSDNDGVYDDVDQCPSDPGSATYGGCPVPDSDGDGLSDEVDACPTLPGPYDGCPLPDSDNDGVTDDVDQCPFTPGQWADAGCPPDSDGDGLRDDVDGCPWEYSLEPGGCPPVAVGTSARPVRFANPCGHGGDTVTIPFRRGVTYLRAGRRIAPGVHPATGTVTITAVARPGYSLSGTTSWTGRLTDARCRLGRVGVTSPAVGVVRVRNLEDQPMTVTIGRRAHTVAAGATRSFAATSGTRRVVATWADYYGARVTSVLVL